MNRIVAVWNRYQVCIISSVVVFIAAIVLFWGLGNRDFYEDEYQVIGTAYNYYQGEGFYKWDWIIGTSGKHTDCMINDRFCNYTRAWPHTWMLAQVYHIFGMSEWSSRLISVLFGILFASIIYPVTLYFTKRRSIAFVSAISLAFAPQFIETFRYTRMYALLIPLFYLLVYTISKGLLQKQWNNTGSDEHEKSQDWKTYLYRFANFQYGYLGASMLLMILLYYIHVNSLIILPVVGLYVLCLYLLTREPRYLTLLTVGTVVIGLVSSVVLLNNRAITNSLSLFNRNNYEYFWMSVSTPLGVWVGIILILASFWTLYRSIRRKSYELLLPYLLVIIAWGFFIWVADRYVTFLYFSHIIPWVIVIQMIGLIQILDWILIKIPQKKALLGCVVMVVSIISVTTYAQSRDMLYGNDYRYGSLSIAYETIQQNFDYAGDEVIFGQLLRTYYLRDMDIDYDRIINMGSNKSYSLGAFEQDLYRYSSGWITWEEVKTYHLDIEVIQYIQDNFQQYHGPGVDDTKVFVYYYDQSMLP